MAGLTYNTAAGDLTIGGIAMNCPGWRIQNLHILQQPAAQRGDDRLIPGAAGVLAYQRRATVTKHTLELLITGTADRTGVAAADRFAQLASNIDYLEFYVVRPTGTGDGTRSAVLTMPGGTTRTEPVHVVGMEFGDVSPDGAWMRAILEISIPSGRFT
jgi:hypothetical protein